MKNMVKGPETISYINCPNCHTTKYIIRSGTRYTKLGPKQQFYCKACNKYFRDTKLPQQHHPSNIILSAISIYNLGYTILQTNTKINRRFKSRIPRSTLHSWLKRYSEICTFTTQLRKQYKLDPKSLIFSKKFHHQQVYEFKFHTLKSNIAGKTFPKLRDYLRSLPKNCPNKPFQYGPRCSNLRIDIKPTRTAKHNNAPKLAELAQLLASTNRERHQKVEDFFLINDSVTVAIEVPVYLYPYELNKKELKMYGIKISEPLSGHIDILQVRWDKIHLLDYKPDAKKSDKAAADQIFLYALALSKRTKIPLDNFICAYFDDKEYFQLKLSNIIPSDSALKNKPDYN